jgi:hypothetical protein
LGCKVRTKISARQRGTPQAESCLHISAKTRSASEAERAPLISQSTTGRISEVVMSGIDRLAAIDARASLLHVRRDGTLCTRLRVLRSVGISEEFTGSGRKIAGFAGMRTIVIERPHRHFPGLGDQN